MAVPLVRDQDNKMLAGICSGLAVYFDMDVTLMRVLWVVVAVLTGFALVLAYIIMIFVIPEGVPQSRTADEDWQPVEE